MDIDFPLADQFDEAAFVPNPIGPSSRSCCKVLNTGSCGSGSIVGFRAGKTLVITNAHVAGTRIGHVVKCQFPFLNNITVDARVILAAYSDTVMMDWAILEIDQLVSLPAVKLANVVPSGRHYTAGYPKCVGPKFQEVVTREITHNGTVWKWTPNSIGGQSGSAVHSLTNNNQYGLLTWSWGGYGAGQTTRSIWFQYQNRAVVGFPRPEGLIELGNRADEVESGFFSEANITELPIWVHLDNNAPPPPPQNSDLAKLVLSGLDKITKSIDELVKAVSQYKPTNGNSDKDKPDSSGGLFGL